MAADAASINISIDSMSLGLISSRPTDVFPGTGATGYPSIIYKGSVLLLVPAPLILILTPEPGCPLFCITVTPATLP